MKQIVVRQPNAKEFEQVKLHIKDFWLDDSGLQVEQFRILLLDNELVGFGRLRINEDATELCTLGVIKEMQGQGYGKAMVKALVSEAGRDVYAVCIIPGFFVKAGFIEVDEYPKSIAAKVNLCTTYYHVGVPYKVMKWVSPSP
jgi:N-acetylglutamate synthase-like GNAT family acetyltransferase